MSAVGKADSSFEFVFVKAELFRAKVWRPRWIHFILDFKETIQFKLHETSRLITYVVYKLIPKSVLQLIF